MKRAVASILAAGLLAASLVTGAPAGAAGSYRASETTFPSVDGTMLYAQVFRPAGLPEDARTPVVLVVTPYQIMTASTGPELLYPELDAGARLFERGYTIVQVSLRGYGRSEGCSDLGGPGDQMDVQAAIRWASEQAWSTGKVGMYGISYDGWTQVMALAGKSPGLSAAVISSPLLSAYRGLYMNRVHYAAGWHGTPASYAGIAALSVGAPNGQEASCYQDGVEETANDDPDTPYWQERDLVARARRAEVPTFWTFGFMDDSTKPDNLLDVYEGLRGETRGWFGQFEHQVPERGVGLRGFSDEVARFFDRHLRGAHARLGAKVQVQDGGTGFWRAEERWPPPDARVVHARLLEGTYFDGPSDDEGEPSERGTWSFSQPLPYDVHLSGAARANVVLSNARGGTNVHVRLFDVAGDEARLIARGAEGLPGLPSEVVDEKRVRFDLYPQDWTIEKGHRLGVLVSGADNGWFDPGTSGVTVSATPTIALPFLRFERTVFSSRRPSEAMAFRDTLTLDVDFVDERTLRIPLPPRLR